MDTYAEKVREWGGHDPVYLNTAWTVQAGRGILLWLVACACAGPIADFYEQDILAVLFPVTALTLVIHGFASTKEATTQKKIMLGRITAITLGTQVLGIIVNVVLALILQSVWSLVFGGLVASTVRMILTHTALPGERNRLAWNSEVFWDLFHFGKYIMIGSAAGFMVNQGDRAILGKFVTLTDLAVYNIGWMFAALPMTLSRVLGRRILFPLYAEAPPKESAANRHNISKVRFAISGGMLSVALLLGLIGDVMIRTLYLPEYHLAGAILVLVAASVAPTIILSAYGGLLLGSGSSRDFTVMLIVTATVQTTLLYYGVSAYGLIGAILAPGLAQILVYPLTVFLVRRHGGWDPRHDGVFALVAIGIAVIVLLVHP
ncbi:MAG: oligosaccharide flippase family protein, partial [Paracoccaceae bacterium]